MGIKPREGIVGRDNDDGGHKGVREEELGTRSDADLDFGTHELGPDGAQEAGMGALFVAIGSWIQQFIGASVDVVG